MASTASAPGTTRTNGAARVQTQVQTASQTSTITTQPVLRLRGAATASEEETAESSDGASRRRARPHIQWAEDVVDNEGLGRKKSKVCCIYHKPREMDESSDESSSSSSDDESSGDDDGAARPSGGRRDGCGHGHRHGHGKGGKGKRERSPNAYEKVPKVKGKEKGKET